MTLKIYEYDDGWGWSIFDAYMNEVAANTNMHPTRELARKEAYAALSDFDIYYDDTLRRIVDEE